MKEQESLLTVDLKGEENERVTWSERFEGVVLPLQVVLFAVALFLASLAYKTHKEAGCDV